MEKYTFPENIQREMEASPIPFAVYQFIDKGVLTVCLSAGFCTLFGYADRARAYDEMTSNMFRSVHPDDHSRVAEASVRFALEGGRYETIYRSTLGSAEYHVIHAFGEQRQTETGVCLSYVWYTDEGAYEPEQPEGTDTLNLALSQALHRESAAQAGNFDHLTGLPSMSYFYALVEAGVQAIRDAGESPAYLFLDLNGLKLYNVSRSLGDGDKQLVEFASLLASCFSNGNCCRTGEDRFIVFTREQGLEELLDRIFREWAKRSHQPIRVGVYPERIETVDQVTAVDRAKFACRSMGSVLVSSVRYFDKTMQEDAARKLYIVNHLDEALEKGWIQVYYQPIVRAVNGNVCNEEALARWINPSAGTLPPAVFIPPLEAAGQAYKLDLYVVEQVLGKIKAFTAEGLNVVPQSVNLSRSDFDCCDIVEEIRRRVDEAGVSRKMLTIEITESMVGGAVEFMRKQVERFRALGFPVWMDDFGSGYSSLDLLQSLEFDLIKFDMQFLRQFKRGGSGQIILSELLKMTSALGIDAVCEGVETEEQAVFLRELGCPKLQGFLFSEPSPLEEVLALARQQHRARMEDPRDAAYFEAISRVNLFDLSSLSYDSDQTLGQVFSTLPMAVLETHGEFFHFIRSNQAYREYMAVSFGIEDVEQEKLFSQVKESSAGKFRETIQRCCRTRGVAVFDGLLPNGLSAHYFIRYLGQNPISGSHALVIAVLAFREIPEK